MLISSKTPFWSIRSSGLLNGFCTTSAPLRTTRHYFSWQAKMQTALIRGGQLCTKLSILGKNLAKNVSLLMLSISKSEEILQNFIVLEERKKKRKKKRERKKNETQNLTHLSIHQCVCPATHASQQLPSYSFLSLKFLKLPLPPCAALLLFNCRDQTTNRIPTLLAGGTSPKCNLHLG